LEKLLITGASGFIGTEIVRRLAQENKWDIYAVSSGRKPSCFPTGVHPVVANLLDGSDREAVMRSVRPDIMIHLAWALETGKFLNSPKNLLWLEASLHLLRLFCDGGRRFIFSGSSSEYVERDDGMCQEDEFGKPKNLYGKCKLAFSTTAAEYCGQVGTDFAVMRFFSVYGENDVRPSALPTAIQSFLRGEEMTCKAPNNQWDYVYIKDVSEAALRVVDSNLCGIVNVGSGRPQRMEDAFRLIAEKMGCPELLRIENADLPGKILVADTAKLKQICGITCDTDFSTGLDATINWWKSRLIEN
jgi:nucleoside-diphosphate-sugar epimerase